MLGAGARLCGRRWQWGGGGRLSAWGEGGVLGRGVLAPGCVLTLPRVLLLRLLLRGEVVRVGAQRGV